MRNTRVAFSSRPQWPTQDRSSTIPKSGEPVRFLRTAGETGGQVLSFQSSLKPGGFVGAEHLHPLQTSHFQVLTGPVSFRVAGRLLRVARGETVTVLPGTPHRYWNPTD